MEWGGGMESFGLVVGMGNRGMGGQGGTYRDKSDEIWWGGESLGLQGCVAHFFDNSWEEDREAREGNVGAEEH